MKNNQNSREKSSELKRKTQNSRKNSKLKKKTQNSRKKLKTQEKSSKFRHIHMLAMRKRWPKNKPVLITKFVSSFEKHRISAH